MSKHTYLISRVCTHTRAIMVRTHTHTRTLYIPLTRNIKNFRGEITPTRTLYTRTLTHK